MGQKLSSSDRRTRFCSVFGAEGDDWTNMEQNKHTFPGEPPGVFQLDMTTRTQGSRTHGTPKEMGDVVFLRLLEPLLPRPVRLHPVYLSLPDKKMQECINSPSINKQSSFPWPRVLAILCFY